MTRCHRVVSVKGRACSAFALLIITAPPRAPVEARSPTRSRRGSERRPDAGGAVPGQGALQIPDASSPRAGKGNPRSAHLALQHPLRFTQIVEKLTPNGRLPTMAELSQKSEVASFQWDKFIWQWAPRQPRSVPAASPITRMARTAASGPSLMQLSSTLLLCLIDLKAV